jgi:hypothetical protein
VEGCFSHQTDKHTQLRERTEECNSRRVSIFRVFTQPGSKGEGGIGQTFVGCAPASGLAPRQVEDRKGSEADIQRCLVLVRSTAENGHSDERYRGQCRRRRVGKKNLHVQDWSEQPCVRPVCAVHVTAGHNALRGSGPGQKPAFDNNAMAQVGCPDRRIDRLCITCCSPSQPSHHAGCPARSLHAASATGSL